MPEGIVSAWPYGVEVQSYTQPTPELRMALVAPEKYLLSNQGSAQALDTS